MKKNPSLSSVMTKLEKELVGTKQTMSGGLFSGKKDLPEMEYDVIDIRVGTAQIINMKDIREGRESSFKYPTFELLVKRDGMKKAQWTRPFPIREINLAKEPRKRKAVV